ncbi:hypothetical protein K8Q94_03090 [Candidatus Nomurabacteria bacterium]|nr:hypothetical protein [Candidatus Nomurabacteria bacterium]
MRLGFWKINYKFFAFFIFAFLCFIFSGNIAQASTYYARSVGGNWSSSSTWSTVSSASSTNAGTYPTVGDTVNLDSGSGQITVDAPSFASVVNFSGYTNTFTLNSTITTTGNVTLASGMTFTPNSNKWIFNGTSTLISAGKTFYGIDVSSGRILTVSTNDLTTSNITMNGTAQIKGTGRTLIFTGTGVWQHASLPTFSTSVQQDCGIRMNINFSSSANTTISGTVVYDAPTSITISATSGAVVTTTGSTLMLDIGNGVTFNTSGISWNNITVANAVISNTVSGNFTLSNNLVVSGNLVWLNYTNSSAFNLSGSYNINVGGDLTINSDVTVTGATSQTLIMDGTGTLSGTGSLFRTNLNFNTSGIITVSGDIGYGQGTLSWTSGTINTSNSNLILSGSGTTLNTPSANMSWYDVTTILNANTLSILADLDIDHDLTFQTTSINSTQRGSIIRGFTLPSTDTPRDITVGGSLKQDSQNGNITGSANIIMDGSGTWSNTGTGILQKNLTIKPTGTINIGTVSYPNVYFDGSTKTLTYNNSNGGVVDASLSTLNISASTNLDTDRGGGNKITWNNISTLGTATITLNSNITSTGTFTVSSGITTFGNNAKSISLNDLVISSGTLLQIATNSLTVNSTSSISGTFNDNSVTGTNIFIGLVTVNSGGTWTTNVANPAFTFRGGLSNNGTFNAGTGLYTFDTNEQTVSGSQSFTITNIANNDTGVNNGLIFSGSQPTIGTITQGVDAILTFTGTVPTITTLTATANGNIVQYTSNSVSQNIKSTTYYHFVVDNSGQTATMTGAITVNGYLKILNGTLYDGGFQITGNSGEQFIMSTGAFLRLGSNTTATVFPTNFTNIHTTLHKLSTVIYNAGVNQTISSLPSYGGLRLSRNTGTPIKSLSGVTNILGTLTIDSNNTLNTVSGQNYTLNLSGDYINNGIFNAQNGTVNLNGNTTQTLSGNMTSASSSSFYNLTITNSSGADATDNELTNFLPSVVFSSNLQSTNNYNITTASVRVQYNAGSTYTFNNVNWNGQGSGTKIYFRSTNSSYWYLDVSGSQSVSYVNVSRSNANSSTNYIDASDSTNFDGGNNPNWVFSVSTILGSSTDPSSVTVAPGSSVVDLDKFTFYTTTGTDSVTSLTVTLSSGVYVGISEVRVTSDDNNTTYFNVATDPLSNVINFSGGTPIPVTTTPTIFKIRITPKTHLNMPAIPGADYVVTSTVSSFVSSHTPSGFGNNSATITIDNLSTDDISSLNSSAGSQQISLTWTNPTDIDFNNVLVLRKTSSISDAPTEGASYSAPGVLGSSNILYTGSLNHFTDTGLTNGVNYFYKIFTVDSNSNYSSGLTVDNIPSDPLPPVLTINSGTDTGPVSSDTINITASDTDLDTATVQYGFSSDNICDVSDTYGNLFTSGSDFYITGVHTDYLCATASDHSSNTSYLLVGQLNTDDVAPTASVTYSDTDRIVKMGDSLTITATFNKPIATSPAMQIVLSGPDNISAVNMVRVDSTHYYYVYSVGSGDGTETVSFSTGTDLAGNLITSTPVSGDTFTLDNTAPVFSSVNPVSNGFISSVTISSSISYTLSESLASGSIAITRIGGSVDNASPHLCTFRNTALNSGTHNHFSIGTGNGCTVAQSLVDGAIYDFDFNGTDVAGNIVATVSSTNVTFDTSLPYVTSIVRANTSPTNVSSVDFTVTFSESVTGVDISDFVLNNTGVSGAQISNVSGSGTTWTVTVDSYSGEGTIQLQADSNAIVFDLTGGGLSNLPFTTGQIYTIDTSFPKFNIEYYDSSDTGLIFPLSNNSYLKAGSYIIKITSDETLNSAPYISIDSEGSNNDVVSGTTTHLSGDVYTYNRTIISDVLAEGLVPENVTITGTDLAGNSSVDVLPDNVGSIDIYTDTTLPTVSINTTFSDPTNISPISVSVLFSEHVTGFNLNDIDVTGGVAGNLIGSDENYTFEISPSNPTSAISVFIKTNSAQDLALNLNSTTSNTINITYNSVNPTVILTSTSSLSPVPTSDSTFNITATFSSAILGGVTGFDDLLNDIVVANGVVSNLQAVNDSVYTFDVTPGDGAVDVFVPAGVAEDASNNLNTQSNILSFIYDNSKPYIVSVSSDSQTFNKLTTTPHTIFVVFNEDISNVPDIEINGIDVGNVSTTAMYACDLIHNSKTFCYDFTVPDSIGPLTKTITISGAEDVSSNVMDSDSGHTFDIDTSGLTVTVEQTDPRDPTDISPINFTAVFSQTVLDFDETDVTLSGTANAGTVVVTDSGDHMNFNIAVSDMAVDGTVIVSISSDVAHNSNGNPNMSSSSTDNIVTYNTVRPTLVVSLNDYDLKIGDVANVTFTFSSEPSGFDDGDISVSNGTLSSVVVDPGDSKIYTAIFTPDDDIEDSSNVITVGTGWTDSVLNEPLDPTDSLNFNIDTLAPVISENSAISSSINSTPSYVFTSSEAGSISYGTGDCRAVTLSATSGLNILNFESLSVGVHSNCTLLVTDSAGNQSNILSVTPFSILSSSNHGNGGGGGYIYIPLAKLIVDPIYESVKEKTVPTTDVPRIQEIKKEKPAVEKKDQPKLDVPKTDILKDVSNITSPQFSLIRSSSSGLENTILAFLQKTFSPPTIKKIDVSLKTASTVSAITTVGISIGSALLLSPISSPEIVLIPLRLWSLILTGLGIRRRMKPWGVVYDSVTKQPLDPVYVSLLNLDGNEVASCITDIDGRYGFFVPPGVYKVVPKKTNYIFPSNALANRFHDELYQDLYFGDYKNISAGTLITNNIPMDPVNFDWNEFAKNKKKLLNFYSKKDLLLARLSNYFFAFGSIVATMALVFSPQKYNLIIMCLYIVMFFVRKINFKFKAKGKLLDKDGVPVSFALIRIVSSSTNVEIAHQVTDKLGQYHILVPNGKYYMKIEKKNDDGSYTLLNTSEKFEVTNGIINKSLTLSE